ncbi:MAG: tetratricopeptide repeat protein [Rhizobiales bacterium]|nr:tetratricopeptide repeat protein [Hyphomicrobiales bacterium]
MVHLIACLIALSSWMGLSRPGLAQALKGEVFATVENGYARLAFKFADQVDAEVRLANNVLTINFPRPVDVAIERLSSRAAGYVSAARRDPDGKGIRIALSRKVTMSSIAAAERLFVDLLPDTWTGAAPGLPREVIEDLAKRAREGERRMRQQRALAEQNKAAPIRVRAVTQPTFTRYVFDLPELIGVSADNTRERLTLTFDATLRFDLADAKATLPPVIESIESEGDQNVVVVRFNFAKRVDVRTFREDNSFVVNVEGMERRSSRQNGAVRSDELSSMAAELAERPNAPNGALPKPAPVQAAPPPSVPVAAPPQVAQQASPASPQVQSPPAVPAAQLPQDATLPDNAGGAVRATVKRNGEGLSIAFPFAAQTPAAIFRRADTVWMVFDTETPISIAALTAEQSKGIRSASATRVRNATLVRVKLKRPQLISVAADGNGWVVTLANEMIEPTRPLLIGRTIAASAHSSVTIAIEQARSLHRLADPDVGDTLTVITAAAPARGFLKSQDFVEFRALASAHGIALQSLADDLTTELSVDKVVVSRPAGLSLSAAVGASNTQSQFRRQVLDLQSWGFDRQADFAERSTQLMMAAADAPASKRLPARCDLARFYLARDMYTEAKAVLDVALADDPPSAEDSAPVVLRAVANVMIGRPDAAMKDLSNPFVGDRHDAPLWRALANARLGKWTEARDGFREAETAMTTLPIEFQRVMLRDMLRASLETGDITGAVSRLNEFELVGVPREMEPAISVLSGRLAEGLGRIGDALRAYRAAHDSWDRGAAAEGRLREVQLQHRTGSRDRTAAIDALETLTTIWRGDQIEVEALSLLGRLYTEEARYRDAFNVMRTTLKAHPNSDTTRRIQDEAMSTFDSVFLAGKGDALPAIDALALFYDFRELTPIGRRGDEMIRRLADRLVAVDLLYQAGELLQHQVDHRLQGAARAQVASRLAVIYMMERKAASALAVLRATRVSDLNNNMRNQRLLLEARALSELGRHDVAYEVIANIPGRAAIRLRSDILWASKKWTGAAEQLELLHGDRWKEFAPLTDLERTDIMRAAIGYALGDDALGLSRFRERYVAKMGEGPDARAFDVVTAPVEASGTEFRDIARSIAAVDTLEAFLRDLRARYPETGATPSVQRAIQPSTAG